MKCEMKYINIFENEESVRAFFTTKEAAIKGMPGGTLYNNVELFEEMGLGKMFKVWPRQVHGTNVAVIKETDLDMIKKHAEEQADTEKPSPADAFQNGIVIPETDGVITNAKDVLLTSVHGDCLSVFLYDSKSQSIGLVHAGWRSAVGGIVPQAIRKMVYVLGASLDNMKVHIGPGISKCCFEVGAEVATQFLLEWGSSYAEPIDSAKASDTAGDENEEKYLLDLKEAVRQQVLDVKIREENITISEHCTYCEPELFNSYRRDGADYRRMGAGICMPSGI